MKKTLIALAVLAASGAAMAQSSVTLYGVADGFIGSKKVDAPATPTSTVVVGQRQTVVSSAGINGSRWGLKGAEDLGNGIKAVFQLESGFNLDTGTSAQSVSPTASRLFGRQAFGGLSGAFGTVSLGRQYSAYDGLHGAVNHNYDAATFNAATGGAIGGVSANGLRDYTSRVDNSVAYTSPSFSGFSGQVVYGFGENKNTVLPGVSNKATDNASIALTYANGPITAGVAYQEEKTAAVSVTVPGTVAQDKLKYSLIGGSYDFGMAKLVGSYNTAKNNTTKDKEGQIGVVVPFGAAAVSAGYARSKSEAGGVSKTGKGFSLLATYDMSKRTRLYAGAQQVKAFVGTDVAQSKATDYGLGLRHSF